ncbi:MAG: NADH dehydrogenase, partial [Actinomycetia bacterium]|nr:NADH dehydrogenase [Actinomycetes bacterium]
MEAILTYIKDNPLLLSILVPGAAGFLTLIIPSKVKAVKEVITLLSGIFAGIAALIIFTCSCDIPLLYSVRFIDLNVISLDLSLEALKSSSIFYMISVVFFFLIMIFSLTYEKKERSNIFYGFLKIGLAACSGIFFSGHIIFLLIFWEISTLSLFFLTTVSNSVSTGDDSKKGAAKTFAILGFTDGLFLLGLLLLFVSTGKFQINSMLYASTDWKTVTAFACIFIAAVSKAGAFPLHTWIPEAGKSTSAAIMALLPGSVDKLLGVFLLYKLTTTIVIPGEKIGIIIRIIGSVTIIAAVMMALVQSNIKKLLSYCAISQVGYIVLGIGMLNPIGMVGAIFHMLNHSIYKSLLFLTSGNVEKVAGTDDLEKIGGLARILPVTFIATVIATLSISGFPPFN